jgi:hypothetical protein
MSAYQTRGSVSKMAMMLARVLEHKGFDADYAHQFTLLQTDVSCLDTRVVLIIEPRRAPAVASGSNT